MKNAENKRDGYLKKAEEEVCLLYTSNYDEKSLDPVDFMAFTVFNHRTFENIWRKWQPKGNLVFSELPPEAQNALLAE